MKFEFPSLSQALLRNFSGFEERFLLTALFVVIFIVSLIAFLYCVRTHIKGKTLSKLLYAVGLLSVSGLFFTAYSVAVLYRAVFMERPYMISSTPQHGEYMQSEKDLIALEFDIPFDKDTIQFHISPDIKGEWVYENVSKYIPLARRVYFKPQESLPPDAEVVIYVVGIRSWLSEGQRHEQAVEFKSPALPDVASISPKHGAKEVPPQSKILVELDAPIGDFVKFDFSIEPAVSLSYEIKDPTHIEVFFKEPLQQDENYIFNVLRSTRTYSVESGEELSRGETSKVFTSTFTTASTPLLETYKPRGTDVPPDSKIEAVFTQQMSKSDVEANFKISPAVKGSISWPNSKHFLFTPSEPLLKDTMYKVTFSKGIESVSQGSTTQDIVFTFRTPGAVEVKSISPISNASGVSTSTLIKIEFNQRVDTQSAQKLFAISPYVSGSFSWDGNEMTYAPQSLDFNTKYTVTLAKGIKSKYGKDSASNFQSSFTTKSQTFTLSFPWYKQQENFTCNIAATRMVLAYYGTYVSESDIKSSVGIGTNPNYDWVDGYGVHPGPISDYIAQYRDNSVKTGWNLTDLLEEVENGNPVILWWYNRYSQPKGAYILSSGVTGYMGMHSEVVYGYKGSPQKPTAVLTRDPWRGHLEYTPSLFNSNWEYINKTAIVVY